MDEQHERCEFCRERYDPRYPNAGDGWAEMYDPADPESDSKVGHWGCRPPGWDIA